MFVSLTHSPTYFILMCVLTVFSLYVEGNTFMVALEKDKAGVVSDNQQLLCETI